LGITPNEDKVVVAFIHKSVGGGLKNEGKKLLHKQVVSVPSWIP
jgi:hypothetical protein